MGKQHHASRKLALDAEIVRVLSARELTGVSGGNGITDLIGCPDPRKLTETGACTSIREP